jgi:hypothetical protein
MTVKIDTIGIPVRFRTFEADCIRVQDKEKLHKDVEAWSNQFTPPVHYTISDRFIRVSLDEHASKWDAEQAARDIQEIVNLSVNQWRNAVIEAPKVRTFHDLAVKAWRWTRRRYGIQMTTDHKRKAFTVQFADHWIMPDADKALRSLHRIIRRHREEELMREKQESQALEPRIRNMRIEVPTFQTFELEILDATYAP